MSNNNRNSGIQWHSALVMDLFFHIVGRSVQIGLIGLALYMIFWA